MESVSSSDDPKLSDENLNALLGGVGANGDVRVRLPSSNGLPSVSAGKGDTLPNGGED